MSIWSICLTYSMIILLPFNNELETLFEQFKTSITKDVTLRLPNANHPLFIFVHSSSTRIVYYSQCILFSMNDKGKLDNFLKIYRFFTTLEQKLNYIPWTNRKRMFTNKNWTNLDGSDDLINVLSDIKRIVSCFSQKRDFSSIFFHCTKPIK